MSAQFGAPALARAQVATPAPWNARQGSSLSRPPRPARMTRRAMAVAAATLCAPLLAAAALGAVGAATGGNQAEIGTLAGTQGLRGTTVSATNPAPSQAPAPSTDVSKDPRRSEATVSGEKRDPRTTSTSPADREAPPATRAPTHKRPAAPAPTPPKGVHPTRPAPTPVPDYDPTGPGAPSSSTGVSDSGTTGSGSTSTSTSGSSSGSGSTYPDGLDGQSGSG